MTAITKLLLSNISYLKTSYKMNNEFELSMKDLVEQEEEIITVDQVLCIFIYIFFIFDLFIIFIYLHFFIL